MTRVPLLAPGHFRVLCEIEAPTRPEIGDVREQIGRLKPVCDGFLVTDNHLGRATVSSIAVAHEVIAARARVVACMNARDRNLLGLRRDFLTAAAYGVDHFLFVYGDAPSTGSRAGELTVRQMVDEVRDFGSSDAFAGFPAFRVGAAARPTDSLGWKASVDFLVTQVTFAIDDLVAWRKAIDFDGAVFAGVLVLASAGMARRVRETIPGVAISDELVAELEADRDAGIDAACNLIEELRASSVFDGVHLVPVGRYREMADRLGPLRDAWSLER